MMSAKDIARALGGCRNGDGWLVRCPCAGHGQGRGDRRPSLSLHDGDGRLLVHCFAGCVPREVLAELRRRGLLNDDGDYRHGHRPHQHRERPEPPHEPDPQALAIWREAQPC